MKIEVKKLSPRLIDDYLDFFENHAFSDGSEFAGCYCVWYHWTEELENQRAQSNEDEKASFKKHLAVKLIQEGTLNGYLAYSKGKVIGWCNADHKQHYDRLDPKNAPELWLTQDGNQKVLSIVCYLVKPEMRGKGVATELLKAVCKDAQERGFDYIEAYPGTNDDGTPHYHGNFSMYEKQGFYPVQQTQEGAIVRKNVKEK